MLEALRFIHAADLHLGSLLPLPDNLAGPDAVEQALVRVVDAAIENDVDGVILAGDVFDSDALAVRAVHAFNQQCYRLGQQRIPVYIVQGNHDFHPWWSLFDLPENVHVFSSDRAEAVTVRQRSGKQVARLWGQSYQSRAEARKLHENYRPENADLWNIGILHTQLDGQSRKYVPCSVTDLQAQQNIHYWALGHRHQAQVFTDATGFCAAYPGICQGRDAGELGFGGCLLVSLVPGSMPQLQFIPTAAVLWQQLVVDIGDPEHPLENLDQLERRMVDMAQQLDWEVNNLGPPGLPVHQPQGNPLAGYSLRWQVTGSGPLHAVLREQEEDAVGILQQNLNNTLANAAPFIWTDSILVRTANPLPDTVELRQDELFRDLDSIVSEYLSASPPPDLQQVLGQIWKGSLDHEQLHQDSFALTDETRRTIVERAYQLAVEKLLERRAERED